MNVDPKELEYADLLVAYTRLVNELDELKIDYIAAVREKVSAQSDVRFVREMLEAERFARISLLAEMEKLRRGVSGTLLTEGVAGVDEK